MMQVSRVGESALCRGVGGTVVTHVYLTSATGVHFQLRVTARLTLTKSREKLSSLILPRTIGLLQVSSQGWCQVPPVGEP